MKNNAKLRFYASLLCLIMVCLLMVITTAIADDISPIISCFATPNEIVYSGESDETHDVFISVIFDDTIEVGDAYVFLSLVEEGETLTYLQIRLEYNSQTGAWEVIQPLGSTTREGIYLISIMAMTPERKYINISEESATFYDVLKIANVNEDAEAPVIGTITSVLNEAGLQDTVKISAVITDNVAVQETQCWIDVEGQTKYIESLIYNSENGTWEMTLPIQNTMAQGVYSAGINVYDAARNYNSKVYENAFEYTAAGTVTIRDENADPRCKEIRAAILDLNTPLSEDAMQTIRDVYETWQLTTFQPYQEELRTAGATDEARIGFGAKMLYAWDHSTWIYRSNPDEKFQNYLSREDIIEYTLTGKNSDVYCDPDGRPIFWQVNMTDKMKEGFKDGIEMLVAGGAEIVYDYFYESGACVCFAAELAAGKVASNSFLNEEGVIGFNMTEENTEKYTVENFACSFARILSIKTRGVDFYQLYSGALAVYRTSKRSGTTSNDMEVFENRSGGKMLMYLKNNDYLNTAGKGAYDHVEVYADVEKNNWYERENEIMLEVFEFAGENLLYSAESINLLNENANECGDEMLNIDLASDSDTQQLSASVYPAKATQTVVWKSSDKSVATVSDDGLVTGLKRGTVNITAVTTDGTNIKATCKINVAYLAKEISITGDITIIGGKRTSLKAEVLPNGTSNKKVTWESSDEEVATVSSEGVVTTKKVDETKAATITATAQDGSGVTAACVITVIPAVQEVSVLLEDTVCTSETLIIDLLSDTDTLQLNAVVLPTQADQAITWRSSDKSIATVSEDGLVIGLTKGTVTITATSVSGKTSDGSAIKASCKVKVTNLVKEISLSGETIVVGGKSITLILEALPKEASNKKVTWESSDEEIATVNSEGRVTTKQADETKTVTITATAQDGSGIVGEWIITVNPTE